jgi:uncharacterized ParB-like nuclease family protein
MHARGLAEPLTITLMACCCSAAVAPAACWMPCTNVITLLLMPADNGQNYYFAFGGCHRWAAIKQLGLPTTRARLIRVSPSSIDTYLGASSPFRRRRQQQQQQQQQEDKQQARQQ